MISMARMPVLTSFAFACGLLLVAAPSPAPAQDLGGIVGQALDGLTGRGDERRDERRFEEDRGRRGAERRQDLRERERAVERRERAERQRREEEQRRRARNDRRDDRRDRYKAMQEAPVALR